MPSWRRLSSTYNFLWTSCGRVDYESLSSQVGTKLQVVSLSKQQGNQGGSMVVMPTQRIRRVNEISPPIPGVPLCAVDVVPLPVLAVPVDESEDRSIEVRALNHEMVATMKARAVGI